MFFSKKIWSHEMDGVAGRDRSGRFLCAAFRYMVADTRVLTLPINDVHDDGKYARTLKPRASFRLLLVFKKD